MDRRAEWAWILERDGLSTRLCVGERSRLEWKRNDAVDSSCILLRSTIDDNGQLIVCYARVHVTKTLYNISR